MGGGSSPDGPQTEGRDRIIALAAEAQAKGFIKSGRKVIVTRLVNNSRAMFGMIVVDSHSAGLDDDAIRYILLHEEAHLVLPQRTSWLIMPSLPITVLYLYGSISWAYLGGSWTLYMTSLFAMLAYILALLGSLRFRNGHYAKDEIEADRYAARILRSEYGVKDFAPLANQALASTSDGLLSRSVRRLLRSYDIHPPVEMRVAEMRDEADNI